MKEQKITDCGFTQMRFLGDGLIDARKDELNKKTFFTITLLGLKIYRVSQKNALSELDQVYCA